MKNTILLKIGKNCDMCVDYTCGQETAQLATAVLPAETLSRSYPETSIQSKKHVYNTHKSKFLPVFSEIVSEASIT